ncbi:MAG TPA: hypothetical protein VKC53_03155 [Patescibacteria group bacterium]|nr:hypothetical protein [Patescibacteria group bacterium]
MAGYSEYGKGYGSKMPMWKWILLYVIVGGILYYLVYYFFFRHTGGTNYTPYSY